MKSIKYYLWFVKESQSFMKGYNPTLVFIRSLYKGVGFVKSMKAWDKTTDKLASYASFH